MPRPAPVTRAVFKPLTLHRAEPGHVEAGRLELGDERLFLLRGQLDGLNETAKYRIFQGEGRDPEGKWKAEPSVLIMGIPRAEAEALGRRLEQNAIVFIEKTKAPELVVLV